MLTVSARARPSLPIPLPSVGKGEGRGGNDGGITGNLRYKHDEGNEEDISPTGVGVHTKLDAIFFSREVDGDTFAAPLRCIAPQQ